MLPAPVSSQHTTLDHPVFDTVVTCFVIDLYGTFLGFRAVRHHYRHLGFCVFAKALTCCGYGDTSCCLIIPWSPVQIGAGLLLTPFLITVCVRQVFGKKVSERSSEKSVRQVVRKPSRNPLYPPLVGLSILGVPIQVPMSSERLGSRLGG